MGNIDVRPYVWTYKPMTLLFKLGDSAARLIHHYILRCAGFGGVIRYRKGAEMWELEYTVAQGLTFECYFVR